ncbi:hypothetical protein BST42_05590 [Mycolicibacterium rhodesiae]|uniref:Uncharacterized protein n=1 Tax=Mycolicibacterium rhodesiae TaxID=36814 RepID=A0A1X0J3Q5_MYCRH|nr:hypothetical protein BST42_05590 [Mycolicibacterium rhodesiae]
MAALIVGIAGLVTPVSAGPGNRGPTVAEPLSVDCGIAVSPDLSAAREATVLGGKNMPSPPGAPGTPGLAQPHDDIIVNTDYVSLCREELTDRRIWTVTLAALGVVAVLGIGLAAVIFRRPSAGADASSSS